MRYEEHRFAGSAKGHQSLSAFLLKFRVPDGQNLVDQENIGLALNSDREGQPHDHAAGVGPQRIVDEFADSGKLNDAVKKIVGLAFREAQQRRVEDQVLRAGEIGMKSGAQFQ